MTIKLILAYRTPNPRNQRKHWKQTMRDLLDRLMSSVQNWGGHEEKSNPVQVQDLRQKLHCQSFEVSKVLLVCVRLCRQGSRCTCGAKKSRISRMSRLRRNIQTHDKGRQKVLLSSVLV